MLIKHLLVRSKLLKVAHLGKYDVPVKPQFRKGACCKYIDLVVKNNGDLREFSIEISRGVTIFKICGGSFFSRIFAKSHFPGAIAREFYFWVEYAYINGVNIGGEWWPLVCGKKPVGFRVFYQNEYYDILNEDIAKLQIPLYRLHRHITPSALTVYKKEGSYMTLQQMADMVKVKRFDNTNTIKRVIKTLLNLIHEYENDAFRSY